MSGPQKQSGELSSPDCFWEGWGNTHLGYLDGGGWVEGCLNQKFDYILSM